MGEITEQVREFGFVSLDKSSLWSVGSLEQPSQTYKEIIRKMELGSSQWCGERMRYNGHKLKWEVLSGYKNFFSLSG